VDEFARIDRYFRPLAGPGARDLKDDAAVLSVPADKQLVITTDTMVEGVHFLANTAPDLVARKLLRVNLSDLAAMGARPWCYTVTTALPAELPTGWLEGFAAGLACDQQTYGLYLVGGDSVRIDGPMALTIAVHGLVPRDSAMPRSGARPGDLVCASGTLGDAVLGLRVLQRGIPGLPGGSADWLADRYLLPAPRVALGESLRGMASACLDLSDGLAGDIAHICEASGVAATIRLADLPLSEPAAAAIAADPDLFPLAAGGGDDYELLFTVAPGDMDRVRIIAEALDIAVTQIGTIEEGQSARFIDRDGQDNPSLAGWRHF
jgi:thiamine-monophosphate kinase